MLLGPQAADNNGSHMKFTKMHGLGNDYLYVYSLSAPQDPSKLAIKLSDRHFGAGSDGMIWILPSDIAQWKMRIFNADGSEAKMCGNGIRCVGKYLYDKGHTRDTHLKIETLSGVKELDLAVQNGKVTSVTVDMGQTLVEAPMTLTALGRQVQCVPVSVGNPHAVVFTEDVDSIPLTTLGPALERHPFFEDGANIEFVQVLNSTTLRMRVWERGSGVTMACGTGACAAMAAAVAMGHCTADRANSVILDGGTLKVRIDHRGCAIMTGPAETVYEGEIIDEA